MEAKNDKKLDLIAQLLAKAERTTPAEAEALTEHAERLMLKYGIEQAVIDERRARLGQTQEKIVEASKVYTGVYALDFAGLSAAVAFGLGTIRPLKAAIRGLGQKVYMVGFESDVQQAQVLLASLELQAMVAMRAWWAENRDGYEGWPEGDKRRGRSGFLRGFAAGVQTRITANRRTIVQEAGSGTELVLASRLDRVNATLGSIGTSRSRAKSDAYAYRDGHRAGNEAKTAEREISQGRALQAGGVK